MLIVSCCDPLEPAQKAVEPMANVPLVALIVSVKAGVPASTVAGESVICWEAVIVRFAATLGAPSGSVTITDALPALVTSPAGIIARI